MPWYAAHRDLPQPPFCDDAALRESRTSCGTGFAERRRRRPIWSCSAPTCPRASRSAAGCCTVATGVTRLLRHRHAGDAGASCAAATTSTCRPDLVPRFDLYLSFTGGPGSERLGRAVRRAAAAPALLLGRPRRAPRRGNGHGAGTSATWAPTARTGSRARGTAAGARPRALPDQAFAVAGAAVPA